MWKFSLVFWGMRRQDYLLSRFTDFAHKVQIFWKGHKIRKESPNFLTFLQRMSKNWKIFFKMLWPFQNIWTLIRKWKNYLQKAKIIKKYIMLLQNWFFPIVSAIVGRHLFRSMLEKKSTEKSKESWSLTFFSKSQTQWEICAKFLVFVIQNDKKLHI